MKGKKLSDAFRSSVQHIEKDAFIKTVRARPKTALGEVLELAEEMGFKDLTLGDIIEGEVTQHVNGRDVSEKVAKSKKGKGKKKAPPRATTSGASKVINTRTKQGREDLDSRVLSEMATGPDEHEWPASDLTEIIKGASSHQIRQSLARLIENERVTWGGKARGTWYMVVT